MKGIIDMKRKRLLRNRVKVRKQRMGRVGSVDIKLTDLYGKVSKKKISGYWLGKGYCMIDHSTFLVATPLSDIQKRFEWGFGFEQKDGSIQWYDKSPYDIEIKFVPVTEKIYDRFKHMHNQNITSSQEYEIFGKYL